MYIIVYHREGGHCAPLAMTITEDGALNFLQGYISECRYYKGDFGSWA